MLVAEERKFYQEPLLERKPARKQGKKEAGPRENCVYHCNLFFWCLLYVFICHYGSKGYELNSLKGEISRL